jgi:hypothetical protein
VGFSFGSKQLSGLGRLQFFSDQQEPTMSETHVPAAIHVDMTARAATASANIAKAIEMMEGLAATNPVLQVLVGALRLALAPDKTPEERIEILDEQRRRAYVVTGIYWQSRICPLLREAIRNLRQPGDIDRFYQLVAEAKTVLQPVAADNEVLQKWFEVFDRVEDRGAWLISRLGVLGDIHIAFHSVVEGDPRIVPGTEILGNASAEGFRIYYWERSLTPFNADNNNWLSD